MGRAVGEQSLTLIIKISFLLCSLPEQIRTYPAYLLTNASKFLRIPHPCCKEQTDTAICAVLPVSAALLCTYLTDRYRICSIL